MRLRMQKCASSQWPPPLHDRAAYDATNVSFLRPFCMCGWYIHLPPCLARSPTVWNVDFSSTRAGLCSHSCSPTHGLRGSGVVLVLLISLTFLVAGGGGKPCPHNTLSQGFIHTAFFASRWQRPYVDANVYVCVCIVHSSQTWMRGRREGNRQPPAR